MNNDDLTDAEYFRQMMQSVKPLRQHGIKQPTSNMQKDVVASIRHPKNRQKLTQLNNHAEVYSYNHHTHAVKSEEVLIYYKNELSNSHRKKLQQGQLTLEATLDLHRLHVDPARRALCDFIQQKYQLGLRCLLIIHGKGGLYGETPVLKNHVNDWLQQLPQVLAFHSAQQRHGGTGAVYVILRR